MDIDLENGGGGGNEDAAADLRCPNPADRNKKERQPLTWRRAAPYIAALLAGAALVAVGAVLFSARSCTAGVAAGGHQQEPSNGNGNDATRRMGCNEAVLVGIVGAVAIVVACMSLAMAMRDDYVYVGCCRRPRLEPDDHHDGDHN